MRKSTMLLATACAWQLLSGVSYGQGRPTTTTIIPTGRALPQNDIPSNLRNQMVHLQTRMASTDDYLLDLGRAANTNLIADASAIPTTDPPITRDLDSTFKAVLLDFALERHLTTANFDNQTMLLWYEPDVVALAKQIIAATDAPESKAVQTIGPNPSRFALNRLLTTYFKATYGWDGRAPGFTKDIKIADLPPALRTQVVTATKNAMVNADALRHREFWFTDEFWQQARLWTEQTRDQGHPLQLLMLGHNGQDGGSTMSFAVFRTPAGQETPPGLTKTLDWPLNANLKASPIQADIVVLRPPTPTVAQKPAVPAINGSPLDLMRLEAETALQTKVSFEVRHEPLAALLAALKQKTRVALQAEPDAVAGRLITAHVAEMSLARFMDVLQQLYGTVWIKQAHGYRLTPGNLSPFQRGILQMGNREWFHYSPLHQSFVARRQQEQALADEVIGQLDQAKLESTEGVPLSALPAELQQKIRHKCEVQMATKILPIYAGASRLFEGVPASTLHVESVVPTPNLLAPGDIQLSYAQVISPDGRLLAQFRIGTLLPPNFP